MIFEPERRLWSEIIRYAIKDIRFGSEVEAQEAYEWLMRDGRDEQNGFENIAESLGLNVELIRKKAKEDICKRDQWNSLRVKQPEHRVEALGV